jgi:type II secretory pathway pseudopilin PulG
MKKQAFTLMGIIVVVIVIGILATVTIPIYQNAIEDAKAKACQTNLEALLVALDIYAMEQDKIPATLSELPWEYIQRAYVKILQKKDVWKIKLAYFILEWQKRDFAYAEHFINRLAKGDIKLITCLADTTPPAEGGISYGLNSTLANMSSQEYQALSADTFLIGDCESATFTSSDDLSKRHKHFFAEDYAQAIDKDAETFECTKGKCKGKGKGKGLKK